MRKILLKVSLALVLVLTCSHIAFAGSREHWAINELIDFKQCILSLKDTITGEEWDMVQTNVLNEERLDQPVSLSDWAALVKMLLDPDNGENGQMMELYVYNLGKDGKIAREDAVGGLVKLLTVRYIRGSATSEELEPAKALRDLSEISDHQLVLVQKAYCEGILDSHTAALFRPKDYLTNAEAISMLSKAARKYNLPTNNQRHWALDIVKQYRSSIGSQAALLDIGQSMSGPSVLDNDVTIENWNILLGSTLDRKNTKYEKGVLESYTFGLAEQGHIKRDKAVAGLVKLLHTAGFIPGRDATNKERAAAAAGFSDFQVVFDQSKLSIAFAEGLIKGYGDGSFHPQKNLTNAEALALIFRVNELYKTNAGLVTYNKGGYILTYPSPNPNTLEQQGKIINGTVLKILGNNGEFLQVRYEGPAGFIEAFVPQWYLDNSTATIDTCDDDYLVLREKAKGCLYPNGPEIVDLKPGKLLKPLLESGDWAQVQIIVYDIPNVLTAWIKKDLLESPQKMIWNEGFIPSFAKVYYVDDFPDIETAKAEEPGQPMSVFVIKTEKGYAYVQAAGGWTAWLEEKWIRPTDKNIN